MLLFWLSGAFLGGLVSGTVIAVSGIVSACLLAISAASSISLRRTRYVAAPLILAAFAAGIWRSPHAGAATPSELRYYNGRLVQIQGVVDAEPDIRDTGANYLVTVSLLTVDGHKVDATGRLQVHTSSAVQIDYGERVSLAGRLFTAGSGTSSGVRQALAGEGVYSEMHFPKLTDLGPSATGLLGRLVLLRQWLEQGINRWLPEPEAALLIAIVLGAKSATLGDLAPALVSTGLIHLIAISGIKVALIAGMMHELVRRRLDRFSAAGVALGALWLYVLLTGATPSGVRSAIMWSLVFLAAALGRGTATLVSLGVAAGVMAGVDPTLIGDIGFQLSVVGTFAIVVLAEPLQRVLRWVPSPWRQTLAVTLAAQIGTLPVIAVGFHVLSVSGPLANMFVLPLLPFLILAGLFLGISAGLPTIAAPLSTVVYLLLHAVVLMARWLASGLGTVQASTVSPAFIVAYYLAFAGLGVFVLRRLHWNPLGEWHGRGREFAISGVLGATALTVSLAYPTGHPAPTLDWLGAGNSGLISAAGTSILIDGSGHPFTLLERLGQLLPSNRLTIDTVVVTDPRAANVSGLTAAMGHYAIGKVVDVGAEYPSGTYVRWRSLLAAHHVPVYALRTGASIAGAGVRISVVGPDALYPKPADCAGLLRISLAHTSVLWIGIASLREQDEALFRQVDLRADTLVAAGPLLPDFVRAVHPRLILDSTSEPAAVHLPANAIRRLAG